MRRLAFRAAILAGLAVYVWWWVTVPVTSPVAASGYEVVDATTIRVSAGTPQWCTVALDRVVETATDVTIDLAQSCGFHLPGPQAAYLKLGWVVVHLGATLDGRTLVLSGDRTVPMLVDASP